MELEVNYRIFDRKDFKWNIGANITFVKSKILQLPIMVMRTNRQGGTEVYKGKGSNETVWKGGIQEGQSYGDIYGFKMMGVVRDEADLANYAYYVDKIPSKPVYMVRQLMHN